MRRAWEAQCARGRRHFGKNAAIVCPHEDRRIQTNWILVISGTDEGLGAGGSHRSGACGQRSVRAHDHDREAVRARWRAPLVSPEPFVQLFVQQHLPSRHSCEACAHTKCIYAGLGGCAGRVLDGCGGADCALDGPRLQRDAYIPYFSLSTTSVQLTFISLKPFVRPTSIAPST